MVIIKIFRPKFTFNVVFPFFLFLMTALASIFTMHTLKKSENLSL